MKRAAAGMVGAAVLVSAALTGVPAARAHDPGAEPASAPAPPEPAPQAPAPAAESRETQAETTATPAPVVETHGRWHDSTLLFDQSATTQTLHLGRDYQSYNPTYELWVAFRPRYFLYETEKSALSLNGWANAYLELTNSDTTTTEREPLLGPTYLWASYARTFQKSKQTKTVLTIGPRVILPTDKASLGSGILFGLGGLASASQHFGLRGDDARMFKSARIGGAAIYTHPFVTATSTTNDNIKQVRQDVAGRTIVSDELTGAMQVKHALSLSASGDLRILPRWELSVSYVWLQAWPYAPPKEQILVLPTGPVDPSGVRDPTTYRLSTWATASLTYELSDAFSLSLGYYNLATQIGPDGTRRSPLWSPSARVFLTVTGYLDVIYAHYGGKSRSKS